MRLWNGGFEKVKAAVFLNRILTFIYERFKEKYADTGGKICVK